MFSVMKLLDWTLPMTAPSQLRERLSLFRSKKGPDIIK